MLVNAISSQRINNYPININKHKPEAKKADQQPSFKSWAEWEMALAYVVEFGSAIVVGPKMVAWVIKAFTDKSANDNFKLR